MLRLIWRRFGSSLEKHSQHSAVGVAASSEDDYKRNETPIENPRNVFNLARRITSATWLRRLGMLDAPAETDQQSDLLMKPKMHENGVPLYYDREHWLKKVSLLVRAGSVGFIPYLMFSPEPMMSLATTFIALSAGVSMSFFIAPNLGVSRMEYLPHNNSLLVERVGWLGQSRYSVISLDDVVHDPQYFRRKKNQGKFVFNRITADMSLAFYDLRAKEELLFNRRGVWAEDPACLEDLRVPYRKLQQ